MLFKTGADALRPTPLLRQDLPSLGSGSLARTMGYTKNFVLIVGKKSSSSPQSGPVIGFMFFKMLLLCPFFPLFFLANLLSFSLPTDVCPLQGDLDLP